MAYFLLPFVLFIVCSNRSSSILPREEGSRNRPNMANHGHEANTVAINWMHSCGFVSTNPAVVFGVFGDQMRLQYVLLWHDRSSPQKGPRCNKFCPVRWSLLALHRVIVFSSHHRHSSTRRRFVVLNRCHGLLIANMLFWTANCGLLIRFVDEKAKGKSAIKSKDENSLLHRGADPGDGQIR